MFVLGPFCSGDEKRKIPLVFLLTECIESHGQQERKQDLKSNTQRIVTRETYQ